MSDQAVTPPPKALIFDLLTALLDSWTLWTTSIPPDLPSISPSTSPADLARLWRLRYLTLTYTQGPYTPYENLVHRAAADVNLPPSAPAALLENWSNLKSWPDVPATLAAARRAGFKLGVVTNCSKELGMMAAGGVEAEVARYLEQEAEGSEGFKFDAVVTAEECGWYKPAAPAYEAILPRLGVSKEEVLFVAGSAGDVQGAGDVGMRVVWHNQVGMERRGGRVPLREGRSLRETLGGVLD